MGTNDKGIFKGEDEGVERIWSATGESLGGLYGTGPPICHLRARESLAVRRRRASKDWVSAEGPTEYRM